jgi:hypothetical protein
MSSNHNQRRQVPCQYYARGHACTIDCRFLHSQDCRDMFQVLGDALWEEGGGGGDSGSHRQPRNNDSHSSVVHPYAATASAATSGGFFGRGDRPPPAPPQASDRSRYETGQNPFSAQMHQNSMRMTLGGGGSQSSQDHTIRGGMGRYATAMAHGGSGFGRPNPAAGAYTPGASVVHPTPQQQQQGRGWGRYGQPEGGPPSSSVVSMLHAMGNVTHHRDMSDASRSLSNPSGLPAGFFASRHAMQDRHGAPWMYHHHQHHHHREYLREFGGPDGDHDDDDTDDDDDADDLRRYRQHHNVHFNDFGGPAAGHYGYLHRHHNRYQQQQQQHLYLQRGQHPPHRQHIDPDAMTYDELSSLCERIGTVEVPTKGWEHWVLSPEELYVVSEALRTEKLPKQRQQSASNEERDTNENDDEDEEEEDLAVQCCICLESWAAVRPPPRPNANDDDDDDGVEYLGRRSATTRTFTPPPAAVSRRWGDGGGGGGRGGGAAPVFGAAAAQPPPAVVQLPCLHYLHYACAAKYLSTKHTCPVCRQDLNEVSSQQYRQLSAAASTRQQKAPAAFRASPATQSSPPQPQQHRVNDHRGQPPPTASAATTALDASPSVGRHPTTRQPIASTHNTPTPLATAGREARETAAPAVVASSPQLLAANAAAARHARALEEQQLGVPPVAATAPSPAEQQNGGAVHNNDDNDDDDAHLWTVGRRKTGGAQSRRRGRYR